jgi:hypothetical protein
MHCKVAMPRALDSCNSNSTACSTGKMLFASQQHITNKFTQNFHNWALEELLMLGSVSFLSH